MFESEVGFKQKSIGKNIKEEVKLLVADVLSDGLRPYKVSKKECDAITNEYLPVIYKDEEVIVKVNTSQHFLLYFFYCNDYNSKI